MSAEKPDLVLTRLIGAPRERVWKAWTDPKQFAKWWGPHHFTCPVCEIDVRPGGKIYLHMKDPDGSPFSESKPMGESSSKSLPPNESSSRRWPSRTALDDAPGPTASSCLRSLQASCVG